MLEHKFSLTENRFSGDFKLLFVSQHVSGALSPPLTVSIIIIGCSVSISSLSRSVYQQLTQRLNHGFVLYTSSVNTLVWDWSTASVCTFPLRSSNHFLHKHTVSLPISSRSQRLTDFRSAQTDEYINTHSGNERAGTHQHLLEDLRTE